MTLESYKGLEGLEGLKGLRVWILINHREREDFEGFGEFGCSS